MADDENRWSLASPTPAVLLEGNGDYCIAHSEAGHIGDRGLHFLNSPE
ncbi:hypothetical protein MTX26_27375 [Bradyrhizobium sp. ISRA443]|nr:MULTISPECIES: hypothetical protein [unclassified Bradyrhizobium]WGR93451.1 hypothetical protein MTX20_02205 [Bradyrhizobium sp. ISRA435]WGR98000.1 hypothetical protein MTX23_27370 [Bradyrhizobium sp. ISRA436]WGS04890.1 hypothetical protein MTX18_27380 [Bradyrhizobium sp. ISRA437]WGS11772.1 hypothetical protein MTX26_27375 [Bradyrhizobium sp. ISRA443]